MRTGGRKSIALSAVLVALVSFSVILLGSPSGAASDGNHTDY